VNACGDPELSSLLGLTRQFIPVMRRRLSRSGMGARIKSGHDDWFDVGRG
jgi:hypothetical protein